MASGQLIKDVWHMAVVSIAARNSIRVRRWGMRVTVYLGGAPGDYVLSYNTASINLNDDANWVKVANIGVAWGGSSESVQAVNTAPAVINLNFAGLTRSNFVGNADIGAAKTFTFSNEAGALFFTGMFTLTGGLWALTMPANVKMTDARWNAGTLTWTPLDQGTYKMSGEHSGANWFIDEIAGPYS